MARYSEDIIKERKEEGNIYIGIEAYLYNLKDKGLGEEDHITAYNR
jgi:hypothetical protein